MAEHSCETCKMRAKYDSDPRSLIGRIWKFHIKGEYGQIISSPAVVDGVVYFGSDEGAVGGRTDGQPLPRHHQEERDDREQEVHEVARDHGEREDGAGNAHVLQEGLVVDDRVGAPGQGLRQEVPREEGGEHEDGEADLEHPPGNGEYLIRDRSEAGREDRPEIPLVVPSRDHVEAARGEACAEQPCPQGQQPDRDRNVKRVVLDFRRIAEDMRVEREPGRCQRGGGRRTGPPGESPEDERGDNETQQR